MTIRPDKPWSHDIPDGPWDYIVIGTGMGGMTAAGVLSKVGKRVLVIERHNIPGGFTQTFKRPGYKWDVGVHIIGEMTERSYPGRLLKDLTDGELEWEPVGEIYHEFNFPDGFTIQFPDSSEAFRETLKDYFPQESSGIDHYMELVKRAARASAKYFQMRAMPSTLTPGGLKKAKAGALPHLTATTSEVLESIIDDPRLRAVLAAQWGYYGATPKRSSFAMHALMVRHFMYGAYFPVGGAGSIARTMLATVAGAGGWTAVRHSVDEIIVRNGKVQGVRLGNGTQVAARRVISAAGAVPTAGMLGEDLPGSPSPYREAGPAHVSLYLGFKGDIERAGAHRYCRWYYDSWDMEVPGWDVHPDRVPGHAPVLFTVSPRSKTRPMTRALSCVIPARQSVLFRGSPSKRGRAQDGRSEANRTTRSSPPSAMLC